MMDKPVLRESASTGPESLRATHKVLERQVARLQQMAGALPSVLATERPMIFARIVEGFRKYLTPHAEWEESVLYPQADAKFAGTGVLITAGLRVEHRIMERWLMELEEMLKGHPDPDDFSIKAQQLLGLIKAHFEVEEAVVMPLVE